MRGLGIVRPSVHRGCRPSDCKWHLAAYAAAPPACWMRFPFVQRKLSTAVSEYTFKQNGPLNSRSGSSGIIATVFGASGFVGRYVTGELGALAKSTLLAKSATNRVVAAAALVCAAQGRPDPSYSLHTGERSTKFAT